MNLTELNNEFEVLFEELATSGSKGLDVYEKSLCFTFAQTMLAKSLLKDNQLDQLVNLIEFNVESSATPSQYFNGQLYAASYTELGLLGMHLKGSNYDIPVVAITTGDLDKLLSGPYKYPPKDLAYVVMGSDTHVVFSPFNFTPTSLVTRYLRQPTPIVLENLTGGLSIEGVTGATLPELPNSLHVELIGAAVNYAIKTYIGVPEKEVE